MHQPLQPNEKIIGTLESSLLYLEDNRILRLRFDDGISPECLQELEQAFVVATVSSIIKLGATAHFDRVKREYMMLAGEICISAIEPATEEWEKAIDEFSDPAKRRTWLVDQPNPETISGKLHVIRDTVVLVDDAKITWILSLAPSINLIEVLPLVDERVIVNPKQASRISTIAPQLGIAEISAIAGG